MSKVTKTIEVEAKEVKTIKPEQLKAIKEQQAKVQNAFIDIGFIESKKYEALQIQMEATEVLEATKKELEKESGLKSQTTNNNLFVGSTKDLQRLLGRILKDDEENNQRELPRES